MTTKEKEGTRLLDDKGLLDLLYQRFESKEWWIILAEHSMVELISIIESKFYEPGTPANADFELVVTGWVSHKPVIVFAKKSRATYDQLLKLMKDTGSKRTAEEIEEAKKRGADVFALWNSKEGWKMLTEFMFKLNAYIHQRWIDEGKEKPEEKKCLYHVTITAEQAGEQSQRCDREVCANVSAFQPDGQMRSIWLCEEHYERCNEFLSKQPDFDPTGVKSTEK